MLGQVQRLIRRLRPTSRPTPAPPQPELSAEEQAIRAYLEHGRKPWSHGYIPYKDRFLTAAVRNEELMQVFRTGQPLPRDYGFRLDERVVEFPWTLAELSDCGPRLLDAGSTLNHPYILEHPVLTERTVVICTLAPEGVLSRPNVSYLYGDLRDTILRDGCVDAVACVSTLEHVGMDNTLLYTKDRRFQECDLTAYRAVLREFRRVLRPGGVLLLTVPFGKLENHGWTQQFDRVGVEDIVKTFGGRLVEWRCYRYLPGGWRLATVEECADCEYFNIHATPQYGPDFAAAARAVACLRLVRQ